MKLRIGIIGCGGIANGKHMPALKKLDDVEMVAFCDLVPERADKAVEEFGAPGSKAYTDYKKMLAEEKLDVVHVLTPNRSHSEISVAALDSGRHVMCEKPMAINTAEAEKMIEASKRNNKQLTIGYQSRYRNDSKYLKAECENGELGDIYFAKAHAIRRRAVPTWGVFLNEKEQGGGPLIDIGTHALDLALYFMNNYKPKYCVGTVYHKLNNQTNTGNAWGDWDPAQFTVEDSAFGFIVMENGATISLEASWALNTLDVDEAKVSLSGTKAGADMKGGLRINGVKNGLQYTTTPDLVAGGVAFNDGAVEDCVDVEARQWIDAVKNGTKPTVLPEQAIVVTKILEGIYESAKTGQAYVFKN